MLLVENLIATRFPTFLVRRYSSRFLLPPFRADDTPRWSLLKVSLRERRPFYPSAGRHPRA